MPPKEEFISEIDSIWKNAWLTNMGVKHNALMEALTERFQVKYTALFTNGHLALEMALQAMNLTGEVITTPYTFVSTTHAIVRSGLTPVFCDIDPDTYTIDVEKIEKLITPNTCAIVPVHVYGNICDADGIQKIADQYGLKVLYDAAHAFNETYNGINVAALGDASMFSFHATKVFNTIEGGAIATNHKKLFDTVSKIKNFGIEYGETVNEIGGNAKMNEFQAAMGICNLKHLDEEIRKREKVVQRYREHLENRPGIKLCPQPKNVKSNYAYFPVVFEAQTLGIDRNGISGILEKHGIYSRKYFYPITTDFDCYKHLYDSSETPIAKQIGNSILTLPLYADLPLETVDEICNIIVRAIK
ncbi:DegT/DnrJ/EryC1/StrS family aminotransferase [Clostridium sp. AF18-27]|nr:DegT/DnrJ/EryC1/StrS family aminotransferase [Clostridium sp. AF18-27]